MEAPHDTPPCFGQLNEVFPMGENGLRESPERCVSGCQHKTECLRRAMKKDSDAPQFMEDHLDEAYDSGLVTFFDRWSKKKYLKQRKKGKS